MKETNEAKEIFARFKQGAGVTSIAELARALGVAQQSVYNVQANGKIPGSWFRKIADLNNISIDWLTYGEGAMQRKAIAMPDPALLKHAPPDPALLKHAMPDPVLAQEQGQHALPTAYHCTHCATFQKELAEERLGWRELVTENRQLWKEMAELRVHSARLEERNSYLLKEEGTEKSTEMNSEGTKGGAIDAVSSAPAAHFNGQCNE